MPRISRLSLLVAGLLAAGSLAGGLAATSAQAAVVPAATDPLPSTVTADVLPTPQINGVVWKQVIVGNTVYVGGDFQNARPFGSAAGVNTVTRTNMLAYNLTTGALDTTFAPTFDAKISDMAVTPDKSKLIVVGPFTKVNGQTRDRAAVFNLPADGSPNGISLSTTVVPDLNGVATSVAASNSQIWFGGWFSAINNDARNRVGAVSATNGSLLPVKIPVDDGQLNSLALSPDGSQVVLAGNFSTVGGSSDPAKGGGRGLYRASTSSGAGLPLPVSSEVYSYGTSAGFLRLASDSTSFYGTAWNYNGTGNTEGVFQASWTDGSLVTLEDCHGDSYDAAPIGDVVYVASHKHNCGTSGGFPQTAPNWTFWHSTAWTKAAEGVNTKDTYGYPDHPGTPRPELLPWLPQYAIGSYTGQYQATWTVTGNSNYVLFGGEFTGVDGIAQQGLVRFALKSIAPHTVGPQTQDNNSFTPTVRSLSSGQVRVSWPALWDRDSDNLTYQLYRNDSSTKIYETSQSDEWQWNGRSMSFVDTQPAGSTPRYAVRVIDPDGNYQNSTWASVTVSGTDQLDPYTKAVMADGATKLWRLDDSGTAVGDLIGADNTTAGSGVTRGTAGALTNSSDTASTFNGTSNGVVVSKNLLFGPDTFSEEVWFKTTSTAGGKIAGYGDAPTGNSDHYDRHLYLDTSGKLNFGVSPNGTRSVITSPSALNNGQWHQAVATLGSGGMALYVDGKSVATKTGVTAGEHYGGYWRVGGDSTWSGGQYFNGAIDDFSVYPTALTAAQVAAQWNASGRGTTTNAAPTAAFTSTSTGLTAALDASTSSDSDGTVASYAWTFGDGTTGTGKTVSHPYAAAGTYPVKLTVTDDKGATGTVTKNVTVTAPAGTVIARDDFGRTVSGGWGTADQGGAWSISGTASRASVGSGVGAFAMARGLTEYATLNHAATTSATTSSTFALSRLPSGSGSVEVGALSRVVGSNFYGARALVASNGSVRLTLLRNSSTIGSTVTVPGLTVAPGTAYQISVKATGTSPTTISAKVWKAGTTEPTAWQVSTTDSTSALQKAGVTGVYAALPNTFTSSALTVSFDTYRVQ